MADIDTVQELVKKDIEQNVIHGSWERYLEEGDIGIDVDDVMFGPQKLEDPI